MNSIKLVFNDTPFALWGTSMAAMTPWYLVLADFVAFSIT